MTFEHLPYPEGTHTQPAVEFDNRKGRPSVAARAGDDGIWLLDTRARTWQLIPTTEPLLRVSAADDAGEHIVALDRSGRVRVYDAARVMKSQLPSHCWLGASQILHCSTASN